MQNFSSYDFAYNLYVFHDEVSKRNGKVTNLNYQILHREYSQYNINDIKKLITRLKNYYLKLGFRNYAQELSYFEGLLRINYDLLVT